MKYRVLTGEEENDSAVKTLLESLNKLATKKDSIKLGFPGGNVGVVTVAYDENTKLWWHDPVDKSDTSHWNNFGYGEPQWGGPMAATIQLNISKQYAKNGRSLGGAMVMDDNGDVHLAHKGALGGGYVKAGFKEYYSRKIGTGKCVTARDDKGDRELILITKIRGSDVSKNIADYVRVVKEYKEGPGKISKRTKSSGYDPPEEEAAPYSIKDIVKDGCFLGEKELETILNRLKVKKNLILQGPPGTGKTYLAKRLAYALIGHKSDTRVRQIQFHPSLSYEDFVRGWRPDGSGKLKLVDGQLLGAIADAAGESKSNIVLVIEEINRGNPATIFGEMLTLLEADKRKKENALALSYTENDGERVYVPDNLYIIGTMNVADRSLALVDFALRRRFFFYSLEPILGKKWKEWMNKERGVSFDILDDVSKRLIELNKTISEDNLLGHQFKIGHSYVTPREEDLAGSDPKEWFRQVVKTEIGPQLDEYWFGELEKSKDAKEKLLEGF